MNLSTIQEQVAFLERQADALATEINVKLAERTKLINEVRKLKIQHAEEFFGMSAEDCRAAFYRVQELVKRDYYSPADALARVNVEIAPKEVTVEAYEEFMKLFTYPEG